MTTEFKADSSLEGHILIAAPRMDDPRFARSVVLVLRHDEEGAMGIILNRPVDESHRVPESIASLCDELESMAENESGVRIGGPVAGPIIALRTPSSRGKEGGVYLLQGREQLRELADLSVGPLQFFVGHAGWTPGQLESEMESGYWFTIPAGTDFLNSNHEQMWISALRESGRSIYRDVLGIRGFPADATLN